MRSLTGGPPTSCRNDRHSSLLYLPVCCWHGGAVQTARVEHKMMTRKPISSLIVRLNSFRGGCVWSRKCTYALPVHFLEQVEDCAMCPVLWGCGPQQEVSCYNKETPFQVRPGSTWRSCSHAPCCGLMIACCPWPQGAGLKACEEGTMPRRRCFHHPRIFVAWSCGWAATHTLDQGQLPPNVGGPSRPVQALAATSPWRYAC